MIILLTMPRSGSSMTAGIFAGHGIWTGECRKASSINPKGFYENLEIGKLLVSKFGRIGNDTCNASYYDGFEKDILNIIQKQGYTEGEWLYKVSAMYYPPFYTAFPEASFVVVKREQDSIKKSQKATGMKLSNDMLQKHLDMMNLAEKNGAYVVEYEDIISRNYRKLKQAIEGCGLVFNKDLVDEFVEPSLKHY